jgi:hypothetical protein
VPGGDGCSSVSGRQKHGFDAVIASAGKSRQADARVTSAAATARFGEQMVIELIGTAGYYGFVSLVLNANRTPVAEGGELLPAI